MLFILHNLISGVNSCGPHIKDCNHDDDGRYQTRKNNCDLGPVQNTDQNNEVVAPKS